MSELQLLAGCAVAITVLLACLTGLVLTVVLRFNRLAAHAARILAIGESLAGRAHGMASDLFADAAAMRRSVHHIINGLGNGTGSGSRRHTRRQHQKGGEWS